MVDCNVTGSGHHCNVTGSDHGTSNDPKFALLDLFRDTLFSAVAELVGPNGAYSGYTPVFQGDNAGPHEDLSYKNFCRDECNDRGWHWEPQAPQMPHMNNLDLAVFPAMSKAHSELLKTRSNTQAKAEHIWDTAEVVWQNLPSATIARGFVLAYRVANTVINHQGDNSFLVKSALHSNVRADFVDTPTGVRKKTARE
jgi:hypothetical protein